VYTCWSKHYQNHKWLYVQSDCTNWPQVTTWAINESKYIYCVRTWKTNMLEDIMELDELTNSSFQCNIKGTKWVLETRGHLLWDVSTVCVGRIRYQTVRLYTTLKWNPAEMLNISKVKWSLCMSWKDMGVGGVPKYKIKNNTSYS